MSVTGPKPGLLTACVCLCSPQALSISQTPALVRVPEGMPACIAMALDAGAAGVSTTDKMHSLLLGYTRTGHSKNIDCTGTGCRSHAVQQRIPCQLGVYAALQGLWTQVQVEGEHELLRSHSVPLRKEWLCSVYCTPSPCTHRTDI